MWNQGLAFTAVWGTHNAESHVATNGICWDVCNMDLYIYDIHKNIYTYSYIYADINIKQINCNMKLDGKKDEN